MKSNEEIKAAYFQMLDNSVMMDSYERLHKGYAWMVENGYEEDVRNYCNDNTWLEDIYEILVRRYYNNPIKESRMADAHAAYCEATCTRYNAATRQYERI